MYKDREYKEALAKKTCINCGCRITIWQKINKLLLWESFFSTSPYWRVSCSELCCFAMVLSENFYTTNKVAEEALKTIEGWRNNASV